MKHVDAARNGGNDIEHLTPNETWQRGNDRIWPYGLAGGILGLLIMLGILFLLKCDSELIFISDCAKDVPVPPPVQDASVP
jgi:hypothetical protein